MTVIAWKDGVLAADSQAIYNENIKVSQNKIGLGNGIIYAMSGAMGEAAAILDWHHRGAYPEDFPKAFSSEYIEASLVVVERHQLYVYHWKPYPTTYDFNGPLAFGSGAIGAMGAMAHGASAEEAIAACCKIDVTCGLPVVSYSLADIVGQTEKEKLAEKQKLTAAI